MKLDDVNPAIGENWVGIEGEMLAKKGGKTFAMRPQSRQFFQPEQQTSEAALLTLWNGQLYAVIAQPDERTGKWQVRLWWKPFVNFIWYGGVLVALGGLIALLGRMLRRPKKVATNKWASE